MIVSGYEILDLENKKIDDVNGVTVKGAYDFIENSVKPILVCGINNDGVECKPRFIAFDVVSTDYVGIFSNGYVMTVTDADLVTITAIE